MRTARLLSFALLTALIPLASCTDAFGIGTRPIGTWSIEEYNGERIPALFDANSFEYTEIVSDVFLIEANGSYSNDYTFRITSNNRSVRLESYSDFGYWDRNGTDYYLTDSRTGDVAAASVSGGRMVVEYRGDVYRYRRLDN
ncbi:MAG: hypothetical protein H0W69_09035 [Gemmatimonadaceae bacterium]|nr:hypothetical protein [Gemmatimonadaceae bacterium]